MKKFIMFFRKKSLVRNILLSLAAACIVISIFCYALYYYNTSRILDSRLARETQSQLELNNQNMLETLQDVAVISDNLLNNLYQYNTVNPQGYILTLHSLTSLYDIEGMRFVNYTLDTFNYFIANYPILDSIMLYTGDGTVLASSEAHTKAQIKESKSGDFITDQILPQFSEKDFSFHWLGSYNKQEFLLGTSQHCSDQQSNYVFTGIRRISKSSQRADTFLIINLRLNALYDAYHTYPITSDIGSVYLLDADGMIHFSNHEELIGNHSPYSSHLTEKNRFVSFTDTRNGQKQNIFYQSLNHIGFFVLYEIPSSTYASDLISIRNTSILLFIFTIVLLLAVVFWVIIRKLRPIHELTQAVAYVGQGNLGYTIGIREQNEIGVLAKNFNRMSRNLKNIMEEKERLEAQKRQQEIAALQAQINPHFILNTINTVKWMAILNRATNISDCLTSFGRLLEPLLKQQTDFFTVEEEISYLKNYVDTMNYSYGNTIHMTLSIPEEYRKCKIPRFILQPLVENAVLHGVNKDTNEVRIKIRMSEHHGILGIDVFSQGTAIPEDKLLAVQQSLISMTHIPGSRASSIGLTNVSQRISVFYVEGFGLWIENSADCQVKVSVTIPKEILE